MIRHVILWKLKEEYKGEEKKNILNRIKQGLESLKEEIPEIRQIRVQTEKLDSSNADFMLDSSFENAEDLYNYAVHPSHVRVADNLVRPFVEVRMCLDFET